MFICRALTLRWLCGWKLLELQFVAEQITSLHFLDSLNSSRLVGRVMFLRNVTASAFGSTYLICEVTKVDYFNLNSLRNACKVNVPNILKNILNVIIQFTPAPLDEATFYIRLLWRLRSQKDLSVTMGALFLTNYLDGIFTSKFFICA